MRKLEKDHRSAQSHGLLAMAGGTILATCSLVMVSGKAAAKTADLPQESLQERAAKLKWVSAAPEANGAQVSPMQWYNWFNAPWGNWNNWPNWNNWGNFWRNF